ncbi:hypothetical protein [Zunongwangia sp. HRR-M8]|uniref:hypothetical protein n=1 Tax=Zunongwangia sp. HRR-M8 TaxID=3015170 RepID=UPI0022DCF438|nr:hypothetical protein [Zunongwangia sp. HRR-M8]WBL21631.1 hypothetical protein PBT89_12915 [Zunongwangia sp. HRR-M8]
MTIKHPLRINYLLASKQAVTGAGIALLLLAVILLIVGEIKSWVYIPIITTSIGGACSGLFYYLAHDLFFKDHKYRNIINLFCRFCFLVIFWLSLVFALARVGLWD